MSISKLREALRLGSAHPWFDCLYHGGKSSAPAAPDYAAAATAQGAANKEAALVSGRISNPNITNPYGSRQVTWGGTADQPEVSINDTLSPSQQKLFDVNSQTQLGLGDLANSSIGRVSNVMGSNFDASPYNPQKQINYNGPQVTGEIGNAGTVQDGLNMAGVQGIPQVSDATLGQAQDASYKQATSRLDPQYGRKRDSSGREGMSAGAAKQRGENRAGFCQ